MERLVASFLSQFFQSLLQAGEEPRLWTEIELRDRHGAALFSAAEHYTCRRGRNGSWMLTVKDEVR